MSTTDHDYFKGMRHVMLEQIERYPRVRDRVSGQAPHDPTWKAAGTDEATSIHEKHIRTECG
jgi:hypothetical protein